MKPSSIPSLSELEQWLRSGMTPKEASERYAQDYGLEIAPGYIAVIRHRQGWPRINMDHSELIPWKVALEHRALWDHRMLRLASTRRQGGDLSANDLKALESWLNTLHAGDLVVHYDALTEQGWWRVPRRDGVDTDIIRQPSPEDEDEGMQLRD